MGAGVHGRKLADHGVGAVDAGFGLGGAGLGTAAQPLDLGADLVAQAFLLAALRLQVSLSLFEKTAEVAFHAEQALRIDAVELDDLAGRGFQKIAVVAHGDSRERRGGEQFLKPFNTSQVEMVRGLVEQQDIGLADQGFGNGQPLAPAARERCGLGVQAGESSAAGQLTQTAFALGLVDVGSDQGLLQHLADGKAGGETGVLGNIGGAGSFADCQFACIRFDLAGQHRQQRGFASAIGTDEADAVAFVDGERNIAEKGSRTKSFADGLYIQNRWHLFQITVFGHPVR